MSGSLTAFRNSAPAWPLISASRIEATAMLMFTIIGIPLGIVLFAAGLGWMLTPKDRSKPNGCRCPRSGRSSRRRPVTVRRLLQLHREPLEERLAEERAFLTSLECAALT